jgi:hypothetical protein
MAWRELTFIIEQEHGHIVHRYPFVKHAPQSSYITSFTDGLRSINYSGEVPDDFKNLVDNYLLTFDTSNWTTNPVESVSDDLLIRLKMLRCKCLFMFHVEQDVIRKRAMYRKTVHSQDMFDSMVDRAILKLKSSLPISDNDRSALNLYSREFSISGDSNIIKFYEFKKTELEHMVLLTEEMLIETREFVQNTDNPADLQRHDLFNYRIAA